jgi:aspartyl-tRNA(Asn)/glutamyl-tRNA(Gln) amidotransferase subunit C
MSKLDKDTIKNLTQLSRIGCSEEEQAAILTDLERILSYIETLQEIDTKDVAPCNQVLASKANVMREDVVGQTTPRQVFLANAPDHVGGLVRVPPVIKQN